MTTGYEKYVDKKLKNYLEDRDSEDFTQYLVDTYGGIKTNMKDPTPPKEDKRPWHVKHPKTYLEDWKKHTKLNRGALIIPAKTMNCRRLVLWGRYHVKHDYVRLSYIDSYGDLAWDFFSSASKGCHFW